MTLNFRDPTSLEAFLRERIREKTEVDKLDFKLDLKFGERREKLEVVKDINAIANTFGMDYGDHGFLIFGMNREDGRVSRHVAVLDELGTDKLEAQLTEVVQANVYPAPAFSLYRFYEPDVGAWGAIVIWANQTPPFVFSKDGNYKGSDGKTVTLWSVGEWRMRRGAVTVRPGPLDHAHMIQVRVQGAVAPLNARIAELEYRLALVEGQVTALTTSNYAEVRGELTHQGQVVQAVAFTTPETAGRQVLEPYMTEFDKLIAEISLSNRTQAAPLEHTVQTGYGWATHKQSFDDVVKEVPNGYPSRGDYKVLRDFLTYWGLHGSEEDRSFPQAGYYNMRVTQFCADGDKPRQ